MTDKYRTFKRTATDWKSFARARKYIDRRGLTVDEALERCAWWNANRTARQVRAGTKMEFEAEE